MRPTRLLPSVLILASLALTTFPPQAHAAEKYQSRLNSLLIRKNDVYLPSRLVIGESARFVVKAAPGSHVKLFLSTQAEGFSLPDGSLLRVGKDAQAVSGVVPESGILELQMEMPKTPELEGQYIYVDAVSGASEETLSPMALVSSEGKRTGENALKIVKPSQGGGGAAVLPSMPGLSPQVFNQLTQLGDIYNNKDDSRRQLLDNGSINQDRQMDKNPFVQRGTQPGIPY
jgi:hypothetical protein